jgi:integrase
VTPVAAAAARATGSRLAAEPVPWPGQVFPAGTAAGAQALAVAALVDPVFLAGAGWDRDRQVLHLTPDHPQFGWSACRFPRCRARPRVAGFCQACYGWLAASGIDVAAGGPDLAALPARPPLFREGACAVPGCGRPWRSVRAGLCLWHAEQRERCGAGSLEAFLARGDLRPLAGCGPCRVVACDREAVARQHPYCLAHRDRYYKARRGAGFDEACWRAAEQPVTGPGMVVLRGLPPLVIAQVLLGLQRRAGDGLRVREDTLRRFAAELRSRQAATLGDLTGAGGCSRMRPLASSLAAYSRRALLDPETERCKDIWDLAAFGHGGRADFTAISQPWLRQCARDWAVDDLARRRGRNPGGRLRERIALIALLSGSLRARPDHGDEVTAVGRPDIDAFLRRRAMAESAGQVSRITRISQVERLKLILLRMRALGVTRPGRAGAGLGEDFTLETRDVPERPGPGEPSRDLPAEIMTQLCGHLDALAHTEMRVATELLMDTGRRPQEICALPWDCLARDGDGSPVLVYENHKENRLSRRLPVAEATAQVIIAQQQRVRDRFPGSPVGGLALLPTTRANRDGGKPVPLSSLDKAHREWVGSLPVLRTSDGREFDKARIIPYAYRHTYAQRHADAGIAPDVLRELMDHRVLDTTRLYYRVGEKRRRAAVDRLASLHFDRHGNRIWASAQMLLDSEYARRAVGEVSVPFGTCREPSNVAAAGHACPFRFRCIGCDHFRTDASYLPDLTAYLDDLLRTRERLTAALAAAPGQDDTAAGGIDRWAAADATPSHEEITRLRALITRVTVGLDDLTATERAEIDEAVAVVRRHRTVMLGMPRTPPPGQLPDLPHRGAPGQERPA